MKKILFFIAFVTITATSVNAKEYRNGSTLSNQGITRTSAVSRPSPNRNHRSSNDNPWHIVAGYNMLHRYVGNSGASFSSNFNGLYVGLSYVKDLSGSFNIEPGAMLCLNFKSDNYESIKESTTILDLAIPVNFSYSLELGSVRLALLAGPVINIGIIESSKTTSNGINNSLFDNEDGEESAFDGESGSNRFDLMIDAGARLSFNQIGINLTYAFGLLNRIGDLMGDGGMGKSNRLTVGVSYNF